MNIPAPGRTRRDGSPLRPIQFGPNMQADLETIRRLEHCFSLGLHYRERACEADTPGEQAAADERLEAVAAECCELMGFDPDYESFEADAAKSIVFYGCDVCEVIESINANITVKRHLQSTGEISDGD